MKKKITKIWGIGLTFVMVVSLMLIAAPTPVAAADPVINEWDEFAYPDSGEEGDWFWDPDIWSVGPIAEAINGDLYAYVGDMPLFIATLGKDGSNTAAWSTTEENSGISSAKLTHNGANRAYVYFTPPTGTTLAEFVSAPGTYGFNLYIEEDDIGPQLELTFTDPANSSYYVEITAEAALYDYLTGDPSDVWYEKTLTASSLTLFYGNDSGGSFAYSPPSGALSTLATTIEADANTVTAAEVNTWTMTKVLVDFGWGGGTPKVAYIDDVIIDGITYDLEGAGTFTGTAMGEGTPMLMKSTDGGRTWEETDYADDLVGEGAIVDMVCSSLDEDTLYVTDGNYVYKTDDGGDDWDCLGGDSLEKALQGDCGIPIIGRPITSIDVGYQDEDPFVFIGTREHYSEYLAADVPGSVYYLAEEEYGAEWTDMDLDCEYSGYDVLSVGCAPDFDDTDETYVVISDGSETHIVYTDGGVCEWHEFAELLWNCETGNSFGSLYASRIAFPDDWEDTETLFVGVVDCDACDSGDGGDVYSVTEDGSIDRNVRPGTGGCDGDATDIISLDVCGDTDEASLIAGAYCDTTVYYSTDGGWEWDPSVKSPTGDFLTYAIWYGDCGESALAATAGCECAVSLSCVSEEDDADEVGMSWNQISLIATDITCVLDIDHSPGYITDSETMFMVTRSYNWCDSTSLFRNDGTYWERVFCSTIYEDIDLVQVSPDFLDTETVFVTNMTLDIYQSQDAGCSWDRLGYPCDEIALRSWAVLDEDTIYVGSINGDVYLTDRHGSRPWEKCLVEDADDGTDAGTIKYFAFNIADGAMTILVGDDDSQVFLCEVDPDEDWEDQEWHLVGDCQTVLQSSTPPACVVFDPGYAITDDAGENMIYAAAGDVIARCIIDWDEDWADQEWVEIYSYGGSEFWGMKVVGDTVLYIGDKYYDGVVRSLNPTEEDEDDIEWEWLWLSADMGAKGLRTLTAGENGCPDSNVLWTIGDCGNCDEIWFYEDTLATPVIPLSPTDESQIGKTEDVTLTWEALCDAEYYEIELYRYCAECPDDKEYAIDGDCFECDIDDCVGCSDETCCLFVDGTLEPGSTYYWRVRVCSGDPVLSKWSELSEFTTEMTAIGFWDLCSPECGGDDISIATNFSWDSVSDATSYEVQIATNEDFDPVLASGTPTTNAWLGAPELDYGTTYYWRVRVVKDGITSSWVTCIFTTMAEPAAKVYVCPQCGMEFATEAELQAHWDAMHAPAAPSTPMYIWLIIGIGALLVIAVLILIVRTRRTA